MIASLSLRSGIAFRQQVQYVTISAKNPENSLESGLDLGGFRAYFGLNFGTEP